MGDPAKLRIGLDPTDEAPQYISLLTNKLS